MNIDFSAHPLFSWYVVLLAVSGVVLIGLGIAPTGRTGMRVFNAVVGVAFLGYGVYLGFVFDGGTYIIFFKAFFVPVLLIVNTVKSYSARRRFSGAQAQQAQRVQQAQAQAYAQAQRPGQ